MELLAHIDRHSLSHLLSIGLESQYSPRAEDKEMDFSDIPNGRWRFGGYELMEELCRNGIGLVYRARKPFSKRFVALKRLAPISPNRNADLEAADCLQREAETVASLHHPNIPSVYEVGTGEDGLPFFSMRLGATTLASRLNEMGEIPLSTEQTVGMMAKVAHAVQYAHDRGIVHGELRPANILLDDKDEPMIANFGFVRPKSGGVITRIPPSIYNTPDYLAPEQIASRHGKPGKKSDIFSMGAILFELLAQSSPQNRRCAWRLARPSPLEAVARLRTITTDADPELENICARCLALRPADRYTTAGDLAGNLENWLAAQA